MTYCTAQVVSFSKLLKVHMLKVKTDEKQTFQEAPLVQNLAQGVIISNQSLIIQRVGRDQSGRSSRGLV